MLWNLWLSAVQERPGKEGWRVYSGGRAEGAGSGDQIKKIFLLVLYDLEHIPDLK